MEKNSKWADFFVIIIAGKILKIIGRYNKGTILWI